MAKDPGVLLIDAREQGIAILSELMNVTPETVTAAIKREHRWAPRIKPIVAAAFGPFAAARFGPITPMDEEESASIHHIAFLSVEHFESCRDHAVRLYRLNELFAQPQPAPKGKSGPRPKDLPEDIWEFRRMVRHGTSGRVAAAKIADGRKLKGKERARAIERIRRKTK